MSDGCSKCGQCCQVVAIKIKPDDIALVRRELLAGNELLFEVLEPLSWIDAYWLAFALEWDGRKWYGKYIYRCRLYSKRFGCLIHYFLGQWAKPMICRNYGVEYEATNYKSCTASVKHGGESLD